MDRKNLTKNILLTLVYSIFTLFIVLHHEIWADEAQVWLICKHLNVIELFKHLVNEGHPSFFYLLVMPFAKLLHGANAILSMQLICWASSCGAVFLLWQFSPFNKWTKSAITLSAGFLYSFPVIARSYSIIPLVVFLLAVLYPKRRERPILYGVLIAICANIHVIMFGFCAMLALLFFIENIYKKEKTKTAVIAFTAMILGLLAVVFQLHGTAGSNTFINYRFFNVWHTFVKVCVQFVFNADCSDFEYELFYPVRFICSKYTLLILSSAVLYFSLWLMLFLNNKKMFFVTLCGIGFQFFVYVFTYNNYFFLNRIFSAHVILIFALWIMLIEFEQKPARKYFGKKSVSIILSLFLIFTVPNGLKACMMDIYNNYSSAKDTAEFINQKIDYNKSVLFTDSPLYCETVALFLDDKRFLISAVTNKKVKYAVWSDNINDFYNFDMWKSYIESYRKAEGFDKKVFVVVSNVGSDKDFPAGKKMKKVFESKPCIFAREQYRIYEYLD